MDTGSGEIGLHVPWRDGLCNRAKEVRLVGFVVEVTTLDPVQSCPAVVLLACSIMRLLRGTSIYFGCSDSCNHLI